MHVLYHSLHKGSKGGDGGFAVDDKKRGAAGAAGCVERLHSLRGLACGAFCAILQVLRKRGKGDGVQNFLLDKVKGPAL